MSAVVNSLQHDIDALKPWFHNLHLPYDVQTNPNHALGDFPAFKWRQIADYIPEDLGGWRVLDVGCNAGFYTFELAKRGAQVLGIDINPHYLEQANWAALQLGLCDQVEFRRMQVYDLAAENEMFDLVMFLGVFYHLRYPLLGLDIVAKRARRLLIFQTLQMEGDEVRADTQDLPLQNRAEFADPGWPKMAFIEHEFAGDPTNWWVINHAASEALLRSCGMSIEAVPEREIYVCRPVGAQSQSALDWNGAELMAATGRPWLEHVGHLFDP